ncbi:N-acetylmuramoyl-L-alanine amidase family protein [Microcoleus sp. FACHB-672]|uniref:N-acetylmuramoyl-L-alanine amidase family protein n=1 Tax=Microcoleus sp. FACHB-672 TaxID=2692825 RepID=UPI0016832E26|nr:N-acetylmuramoyl-L-alanine amidase [Microcoleus sp. FACHB-672]MBD2043540.1 N-acetylmuramoyl-L-alanine amidase [Microcoleus sp. FACHB-672]
MRNSTPGLNLQRPRNFLFEKTLRLGWVLPSFLGVFLLTSPVHANQQSWQSDVEQNQASVDRETAQTLTSQNTEQPPSEPFTVAAAAQTQLQNIEVTSEGLIIRTSGRSPDINIKRSQNRTSTTIDIAGTTLSPQLQSRNITVNNHGISNLQVIQLKSSPPVARVILNMNSYSPDVQASAKSGGVVVWPRGGAAPSIEASAQLATIQSIQLENNGTQVSVKADRSLTFTTGWDRATAAYKITIPSAQLAQQITNIQPPAGSLALWVRVLQEDSQTVSILVQPGAGVQVVGVNQPTGQSLSLEMQRSQVVLQPPMPDDDPVPVRQPTPVPPRNPTQPAPSRPVPKGRVVVAIDPGHGGRDPGAVGIRGVREKDIVIDISRQVTQLLEEQGVQAIMTRTDDREVSLQARVQMAQRANASLFVSIHANAINMSRPDVNGIETYYYSSGLGLSRAIHKSILQSTGSRDRGVRQARFYVLRQTSMPATLLEVGFVTGAEDAARLSNAGYRTQMAQAIARGILQYIQQGR